MMAACKDRKFIAQQGWSGAQLLQLHCGQAPCMDTVVVRWCCGHHSYAVIVFFVVGCGDMARAWNKPVQMPVVDVAARCDG
jgi:hypothetical protein